MNPNDRSRATTADVEVDGVRETDREQDLPAWNREQERERFAPPAPVTPGGVPATDVDAGARAELLPKDELERMRDHWRSIQTNFVDEPQKAVEEADHLVADTVRRLAESFAHARSTLEEQWSRGKDVSTEDLRLALRRYRSFFDRLLSI